jgi:hypothetical protein
MKRPDQTSNKRANTPRKRKLLGRQSNAERLEEDIVSGRPHCFVLSQSTAELQKRVKVHYRIAEQFRSFVLPLIFISRSLSHSELFTVYI